MSGTSGRAWAGPLASESAGTRRRWRDRQGLNGAGATAWLRRALATWCLVASAAVPCTSACAADATYTLEHGGLQRQYLVHLCTQPIGPDVADRYHGWFPRTEGTITGEWSPDYLAYPWVAPVLAEVAPEAKVLVLLRDPVDRFRSGLTFRQRMGAPRTEGTVADAVRQGFYARWLSRLLEFVPRDQVLVLQYERCRADPGAELARTYAFLGLEPFRPDELRREVNVSGGEKVPLSDDARDRLVDVYREDVTRLLGIVPDLDLDLWPSYSGAGAR